MTSSYDPKPYAAAAAPKPRPPRASRSRRLAVMAAGLLVLALALLAALWSWAGSSGSLASTLTRVARLLPEGQSLQADDVSGSLRAGGRIGRLRWASPQLTVEVEDARIAWRLAPLLRRELRIDALEIARLTLTPGAPSQEPSHPLERLTLPLRVTLPYQVQQITWTGPSSVTITDLADSYRYDGAEHRLAIDQIALAQGRYALQARLQGDAPMALSAKLEGRLQTEVPGAVQPLQAQIQAEVQGQLATADARLEAKARLRGSAEAATDTDPPLSADLQARIAPWAPQPLLQATAELQSLDLAALWPQAPSTRLSGSASVAPQEQGWALQADLHNAAAGPWDRQRLPLDALRAQARYDGEVWTVPEAELRLGQGSATVQGSYRPATQQLQGRAELRAINPAALHGLLDSAPLSGQISADGQDDGAVRFTADLRSAGRARAQTAGGAWRLDRLSAQGRWLGGELQIARLRLDALQVSLQGQDLRLHTTTPALQGSLQASLPGAALRFNGQVAPHTGKGSLSLDLQDAERMRRWLQALPGMKQAVAPWGLEGKAQLGADWQGGWQGLQRQLRAAGLLAGAAAEPGAAGTAQGGFALQARLTAPRLQITMPPGDGAAPLTLGLERTSASLSGTLAQASLQWDGLLRQSQGGGSSPSCAPSCACAPTPAAVAQGAGRRRSRRWSCRPAPRASPARGRCIWPSPSRWTCASRPGWSCRPRPARPP